MRRRACNAVTTGSIETGRIDAAFSLSPTR
jgi:hypothetical protein